MLNPPQLTSHHTQANYTEITTQLNQRGWCIYQNFLGQEVVTRLREQVSEAWRRGQFRHAGVGRGESFEIRPTIRNDRVLWLEPSRCEDALAEYFDAMETLRVAINRELYLGLFDFEAHLAIYPPGCFYKKHLDQFRGIGQRTLTTTLYLNENWQTQQGGQLRLYTEPQDHAQYVDILPSAGGLVCFLSSEHLHEVLPTQRERLSITGWFRQRPNSC